MRPPGRVLPEVSWTSADPDPRALLRSRYPATPFLELFRATLMRGRLRVEAAMIALRLTMLAFFLWCIVMTLLGVLPW